VVVVESVAFASPRSPSREPPESAPASASDRGVAFGATFDFDPDIYRREMRDLVWERSKQRRFAA